MSAGYFVGPPRQGKGRPGYRPHNKAVRSWPGIRSSGRLRFRPEVVSVVASRYVYQQGTFQRSTTLSRKYLHGDVLISPHRIHESRRAPRRCSHLLRAIMYQHPYQQRGRRAGKEKLGSIIRLFCWHRGPQVYAQSHRHHHTD